MLLYVRNKDAEPGPTFGAISSIPHRLQWNTAIIGQISMQEQPKLFLKVVNCRLVSPGLIFTVKAAFKRGKRRSNV